MGSDSEMMMEKGCVNFAIRMSLVITGTLFPHKNIHKATCVSPNNQESDRSRTDKIQLRNSVKDTRVCRSADI